MAGTQKKTSSDTADVVDDAPKLPDEAQPSSDERVAAQAQPMDEQESPVTVAEGDADEGEDLFTVTVNMNGLPLAEDTEVKEGEHDPTLVAIPGLGAFRNGTSTEVSAEQMYLFLNHLQVTGIESAGLLLPRGVAIEAKEGVL